jgi:hypothetical protein
MQTKLTLTLRDDAIQQAKRYAKTHHTSLSRLVQSFFSGIAREESESVHLTGTVHELAGSFRDFRAPDDLKAFKRDRLSKKHDR